MLFTPATGSLAAGTHTNADSECFTTVKQPSSTATQASTNSAAVVPGTSVTDTATVTGSGPTPTGSVTFFLCQPADVTAAGCPTGSGAQVGGDIALVAGVATSPSTGTTTVIGKYCWRAVYSGDGFYNGSNHTNADSECFTTVKQDSEPTRSRIRRAAASCRAPRCGTTQP